MIKRFVQLFPMTTTVTVLGLTALLVAPLLPSTPKEQEINVTKTHLVQSTPTGTEYPDKAKVVNLTLDQEQVHFIGGEINEFSVERAITRIQEAEEAGVDLYLVLDCPGGSVFDGARLISYMEAATVNVNTIVYGLAASMCAQIHAHGDKRYMVDRATLMFHQASGGVRGNIKGMKNLLAYIDREVQKLDAYVADRAGMTRDEFDALVTNDLWIAADDAIELGLADGLATVKVKDGGSLHGPKVEEKTTKGLTHKDQLRSFR